MGKLLATHRKLAIPHWGMNGIISPAGSTMTAYRLHGHVKCAVLVCYDAEFPETVRARLQVLGAELVIVPTALNTGWPVVADKVMRHGPLKMVCGWPTQIMQDQRMGWNIMGIAVSLDSHRP